MSNQTETETEIPDEAYTDPDAWKQKGRDLEDFDMHTKEG